MRTRRRGKRKDSSVHGIAVHSGEGDEGDIYDMRMKQKGGHGDFSEYRKYVVWLGLSRVRVRGFASL